MKIRFYLITYINALNVVKEGLAVFRTVEKEMFNRFSVTPTDTNGIYCAIKTMLRVMAIEIT